MYGSEAVCVGTAVGGIATEGNEEAVGNEVAEVEVAVEFESPGTIFFNTHLMYRSQDDG